MTSKRIAKHWQPVDPEIVCQQIARVALSADHPHPDNSTHPSTPTPTLGKVILRDHQLDALLRLRVAVRKFGGALLADEVGLGKTFVALALAREFAAVHILAPAALLPMWRSAIGVTESRNITLHSLHRLSRTPIDIPGTSARSLVIVDEAHGLRTRATARYRNALAFTANRSVLLLTATPLHNRTGELRNLLALFLGHRADALDSATLASCIVRRTATAVGPNDIPVVVEHPAHRLPDNAMVLECLLTLPPPLPVQEGATASALVRLGLLRAWCSSDAALSDSIRRRQLRGEALLHSLAHGRYPTQRELKSWILGNDSVQLGFPELLIANTTDDTAAMLKTLLTHLDGLQSLLQLHTRTSIADARRVEMLRSLVGTECLTTSVEQLREGRTDDSSHEAQSRPAIVAFSQFASTVRALHRALSDLAGIALQTSHGGRIASGAIGREELIASFAPRAHGRPPPSAEQRIRMLLTTDLLAEGVNLQDAGTVVHLDLPWTDALRQQRVGRLARMGASYPTVDVHTFAPPMGADAILHVVATLERKAGLHRRFVGNLGNQNDNQIASTPSGPDTATRLREYWRTWLTLPSETNNDGSPCADTTMVSIASFTSTAAMTPSTEMVAVAPSMTMVAVAKSTTTGWIAAITLNGDAVVVACHGNCGQRCSIETDPHFSLSAPIVSSDAATLLRAVSAVDSNRQSGSGEPVFITHDTHAPSQFIQTALHQLEGWVHTQSLQQVAGPDARSVAATQKRALDFLSVRFGAMPAMRRSRLAAPLSLCEAKILSARGAGAEQQLERWIASADSLPIDAWLSAVPDTGTTVSDFGTMRSRPDSAVTHSTGDEWDLIALLIMQGNPDPSGTTH